jgi:hypothetical protein
MIQSPLLLRKRPETESEGESEQGAGPGLHKRHKLQLCKWPNSSGTLLGTASAPNTQ